MLRKLLAVLAAVACIGGLAAAQSPVAVAKEQRSVLPSHGNYVGVDAHGRIVSFSFSTNYMSHFTVSNAVIGGAHVGSSAWHETCHNGMCTKGMWVTDTHVQGSWRHGGGAWVHFSANYQPPVMPYVGPYMGDDHAGLSVRFAYRHGMIVGFELDHSNRGDISVSNGRFDTCLRSICVKGHWQSDYSVVGAWRAVGSNQWFQWEVHAYAA
jgi:opacity protein-like surface antigen